MKRAFFGGVHPKGYKELSREAAIVPLHPSVVSVAMSQHIGAPCQPLVKVGDRVTVGQKIGDGQGLCVPVHASVSGTVTAIEARPHPGGNLQTAIVIESDGRDTLCPTVKPRDPEAVAAMSAEDLIAVIREVMVEVFEAQYGRKPVVEAIHAGLECGIFSDRLPGLDAVSFGPQMHDIHTSRERLDIASTARTWEYLVAVLERL